MDNGGRRIFPIILVLVIIAVAIAALVSVGQTLFFGSGQPEEVNQGKRSLLNTSDDRGVRMTVRGPIKADEKYHSYTITAKSTSRTLTTYNGYLNRQIETVELTNNLPAYEQFVYALDRAGMMNAQELSGNANDIRGLCATGRVIKFETLRGNSTVKTLWTSTCRDNKGSLRVSHVRLMNLFKNQIPDSGKILSKISVE